MKKILAVTLAILLTSSIFDYTGTTHIYAGGGSATSPIINDWGYLYANGTPLLIMGESETQTTIYIDTNVNGVLDSGEKSLSQAGIMDAPADGEDWSDRKVYGGSQGTDVQYNTRIVMTGGGVQMLAGGCSYSATGGNLRGDTYIKMTGGRVRERIYGGSNDYAATTLTGNTIVIVTGGSVVNQVSGGSNLGQVTGSKTGIVTSVKASNFDRGFMKTADKTYIAKGTLTLPADFEFTLPEGATLTVEEGADITNQGKITINGSVVNNGRFINNGTIKNEGGSYSGNGGWEGTPIEELKITIWSAEEVTAQSARLPVKMTA